MEHGFTFRWVAVGFGVVIVAKIFAAAVTKYLGISL
jgi:hypothetical protein